MAINDQDKTDEFKMELFQLQRSNLQRQSPPKPIKN